eukprot:UN31168
MVFVVNIAWPVKVTKQLLRSVHKKIPNVLDFRKIVRVDQSTDKFRIRAGVGYYGKHYVAFCWSETVRKWLKFDDEKVVEIGKTWKDVAIFCSDSMYQLTVLFYETEKISSDAPAHTNIKNRRGTTTESQKSKENRTSKTRHSSNRNTPTLNTRSKSANPSANHKEYPSPTKTSTNDTKNHHHHIIIINLCRIIKNINHKTNDIPMYPKVNSQHCGLHITPSLNPPGRFLNLYI